MPAHESLLRHSRPVSIGSRIFFAGVLFQISGSRETVSQLHELEGVTTESEAAPLLLATVICQFQVIAAIPKASSSGSREISWQWSQGICALSAPQTAIKLKKCDLAKSGFSWQVVAVVMPGKVALAATLTAVASALACALGGAVLHCASVQWQNGVIAFIGPSGAGKTTACQHMGPAELFSIDRLLVAPLASGGYGAFSLPGGTVPEAPRMEVSKFQSLPLRAVFGLSHSQRVSTVQPLSTLGQLALLRQCALDGCRSVRSAKQLLHNLMQLTEGIPVARLDWKLGDCLAAVVRSQN